MSGVSDDRLAAIALMFPTAGLNMLKRWRAKGIDSFDTMHLLAALTERGFSERTVDMAVTALIIADRQEKQGSTNVQFGGWRR